MDKKKNDEISDVLLSKSFLKGIDDNVIDTFKKQYHPKYGNIFIDENEYAFKPLEVGKQDITKAYKPVVYYVPIGKLSYKL